MYIFVVKYEILFPLIFRVNRIENVIVIDYNPEDASGTVKINACLTFLLMPNKQTINRTDWI